MHVVLEIVRWVLGTVGLTLGAAAVVLSGPWTDQEQVIPPVLIGIPLAIAAVLSLLLFGATFL